MIHAKAYRKSKKFVIYNKFFIGTRFFALSLDKAFFCLHFKTWDDFALQTAENSAKENLMIGTATQKGSSVEVYDESGRYLFSKDGELQGFTGATVSIRKGSSVEVYDDRGNYKFSR